MAGMGGVWGRRWPAKSLRLRHARSLFNKGYFGSWRLRGKWYNMRFLDTLLRAEHKIQKRIDKVFGRGAARTPLEIRREILDQVENSIVRDGRTRRFPFSRITVHFQPEGDDQRAILRAVF